MTKTLRRGHETQTQISVPVGDCSRNETAKLDENLVNFLQGQEICDLWGYLLYLTKTSYISAGLWLSDRTLA
jgi:hypothetical protein